MQTEKGLIFGPLSPQTRHLCVDMQNLFDRGAPWATPWMRRVLPVVAGIARAHRRHTVFTRFIPPHRAEDTSGAWRRYYERWREVTRERLDPHLLQLLPELASLVPPARVLDKSWYSPFQGTRLQARLREEQVDTLVITGAETDVCVLAAVLDAVDLGYRVVVVQDAVCSASDETHDALIGLYHRRFSQQVEIADADTVLAQWGV